MGDNLCIQGPNNAQVVTANTTGAQNNSVTVVKKIVIAQSTVPEEKLGDFLKWLVKENKDSVKEQLKKALITERTMGEERANTIVQGALGEKFNDISKNFKIVLDTLKTTTDLKTPNILCVLVIQIIGIGVSLTIDEKTISRFLQTANSEEALLIEHQDQFTTTKDPLGFRNKFT